MSAVDEALLDALRCPQTLQRLSLADAATHESLREMADRGAVVDAQGARVAPDALPEAGLITDDQRFLYPLVDGLPNFLLADRLVLGVGGSTAE